MEYVSWIFGGVVGAAVAGVVAYLVAERRGRTRLGEAETAAAVAREQAAGLAGQMAAREAEVAGLRGELATARTDLATGRAQLAASQANIAEQKRLVEEANGKLSEAFAAVSRDALEKNNAAFLAMAQARFATLSTEAAGSLETRKAQIETLLKPLQELLGGYQQRLVEVEKARVESYGQLRQQIGTLAQTESTLATQTAQLVSALTRPNIRGQWGEITLRKLVELSGLSSHCDFVEQASVAGEDAQGAAARLRPDMIVQLPQRRAIVIDAKAVLGAFLDAAAAKDEAARAACLARHAQLVRARARELSGKAYWNQFAESPEFVVLFLPGEAFLYAAVEQDATLIEDCFASKVILATPTTLIALLKTVEWGWRQEAVSRNAEAIREIGTEIYDRLAVLAAHMAKLGAALDSSVGHYNSAVNSLEARLLASARKMGELGVSHAKGLPEVGPVEKRAQELSGVLHPDKLPRLGE